MEGIAILDRREHGIALAVEDGAFGRGCADLGVEAAPEHEAVGFGPFIRAKVNDG